MEGGVPNWTTGADFFGRAALKDDSTEGQTGWASLFHCFAAGFLLLHREQSERVQERRLEEIATWEACEQGTCSHERRTAAIRVAYDACEPLWAKTEERSAGMLKEREGSYQGLPTEVLLTDQFVLATIPLLLTFTQIREGRNPEVTP